MNDMKNPERNFFNIHSMVNANTIEMVDGSKWITWCLRQIKKRNLSKVQINRIANSLNELQHSDTTVKKWRRTWISYEREIELHILKTQEQ